MLQMESLQQHSFHQMNHAMIKEDTDELCDALNFLLGQGAAVDDNL